MRRGARFDFLGLTRDEAGVVIAAPLLQEALAEKLEQVSLFPDPFAERSNRSLMSEGLDAALHGRTDTDTYDEALLRSFEEFRCVLDHDVEAVEIRNGRPDAPRVTITAQGLQNVERLHQATPRPRRVRLAGKLDAIRYSGRYSDRYSDRAFTLVIAGGRPIRGVPAAGGADILVSYFGRVAVVSGMAHFRPSGGVARIEAGRRVRRAVDAADRRPRSVWTRREVTGAVLITTDTDFDWLHPGTITREWVGQRQLLQG